MLKAGLYSIIFFMLLFLSGVAQKAEKTETAEEQKTEEVKPVAGLLSVEAVICSEVVERMPVDTVSEFTSDVGKVAVWLKVTGAIDTTLINVNWYYKGDKMASVELPVKSPFWRTWSTKNILPHWIGDWEIKVTDAEGEILKSMQFKIISVLKESETQ